MDCKVIVLGKNYSTPIGVIRSLANAGYPVDLLYVATSKGDSEIVAASKYLDRTIEVIGRHDQEIVDALLSNYADSDSRCVLFPTDDYTTLLIDRFHDRLSKRFLFPYVIDGSVAQKMDKSFQSKLAATCGLKTAREWVISLDTDDISLPKDISETVYWDETSVFVNTESDYDGMSTLLRYDIKDATTTVVSEKYQGTLAVYDRELFWYEREKESNGETKYHVYYMDLNTFETGEAVTMKRTPGTSEYFNAIATFTPCENGYFYAECDYDKIVWCHTLKSLGGAGATEKIATDPIREHKWKEIGSVQAVYNESYCANCGKKVEEYYEEYFVLNSDLSSYAKDINDALYAICMSNGEHYAATDPYVPADDDECEIHGTYMGMSSYEHTLFDAKIIKDHYLTVDMDGYMYMGGAHGLPFTGHYLFDLNTGKEVTMADLFDGTEEQFKELIATKVKEHFLSFEDPEYSPYYATDADEVYDSAYEGAAFDLVPIGFNEDGLYIDYQPYQMGPYAAGFIDIDISYDDINLKWD